MSRKLNSNGGPTVEHAIAEFLRVSAIEGKSGETILWYQRKFKPFQKYLSEKGLALVTELTLNHGREYVMYLQTQDTKYAAHPYHKPQLASLADSTVAGHVRAARALTAWAHDEGIADNDPFERLKVPKVVKRLIRPLTDAEIERILAAIPRDTAEGLRAFAIVLLFLDTGIRLQELVNARLKDFDEKRGTLYVFGKGAKERKVPVGIIARRALVAYIQRGRPTSANSPDSRLFLNGDGLPMTVDAVEKIFARLRVRSGVLRLHPHLLRHTSAVRFLMSGGDAFSLMKLLGHTSLSTTRIYVELADEDLQAKHRLSSPVDNMQSLARRRGRPRKDLQWQTN